MDENTNAAEIDRTHNHGYAVPEPGTDGWDEPLNENFQRYDTDIEVRDDASNRSNYEPKAGAKFLAVDTGSVFVGDGSAWNRLETSGPTPTLAALNPRGDFLGVGRETPVASAEAFGVAATAGDGDFGGMFVDGSDPRSRPFYGYATDGSHRVLHYYDGRSGQWRLRHGGDVLAVDADGRVGVGTTDPGTDKVEIDGRGDHTYGLDVLWNDDSFGAAVLARNTGNVGDGIQATGGSGRAAVNADAEDADYAVLATGDVRVNGTLQAETKNFVQAVDTGDGPREVAYTAVEADRAHTETSGVVELDDGRGTVELPDHFAWVTSEEEPLVVQVTPHAREPANPQVTERSTHRIVVEDFENPTGSYDASYTVRGTREGHEDPAVVREPPDRD